MKVYKVYVWDVFGEEFNLNGMDQLKSKGKINNTHSFSTSTEITINYT